MGANLWCHILLLQLMLFILKINHISHLIQTLGISFTKIRMCRIGFLLYMLLHSVTLWIVNLFSYALRTDHVFNCGGLYTYDVYMYQSIQLLLILLRWSKLDAYLLHSGFDWCIKNNHVSVYKNGCLIFRCEIKLIYLLHNFVQIH